MDFMDAVKTCLRKYFTFRGRAQRSEYWWFYLFFLIVVFVFLFLTPLLGRTSGGLLSILLLISYMGTIVPYIALTARRMHDSDKSGWFQLIPFYNIYLAIIKGTDGPNRFGPDPLGGTGNTFDLNISRI